MSTEDRDQTRPLPGAEGVDVARKLAEELAAERGAAAYRVSLENFEGPLDLLLHLIQQHELDIMNIPIGFITSKYVEYIVLMQELNIDVASEYLVMAATLAHIKSKMMLPPDPSAQDEEEPEAEEDPRLELVRRLLEYQKYKLAAAQLAERSIFGRDVFARGLSTPEVGGEAPLAPVSIFKLLDAFQSVLRRAKTQIDHEIQLDRLSISDRINQLADVLRKSPRMPFEDLFEGQRTRPELIVTFLALLEMTRLRMIRLFQDAALGPISLELAVREDEVEAMADAAMRSMGAGGTVPPDARRSEPAPETDAGTEPAADPELPADPGADPRADENDSEPGPEPEDTD